MNKSLSEFQQNALDLIFIDENCFISIANAVAKFKSEVTSSHSVGRGPYSIAALFQRLIDPAFKEFMRAFPSKLPQKSPPLSNIFRDGLSLTDIYLADLALLGKKRGLVIVRSLDECLDNSKQDAEFDAEKLTVTSTLDTIRHLVDACYAFQPKQKRKKSPYGLGRNNKSRVWVASREVQNVDKNLSNEKYREIKFSKYPFCKFCFRYCEHFQSQITVRIIAGTNVEISNIPLSSDLDERIRPNQSIECCKEHATDRNARDRDRRSQPIFYAMLSALIWLRKKKYIPLDDLEDVRELAYTETRKRTPVAKKMKSLIKANPLIADQVLGEFLLRELSSS